MLVWVKCECDILTLHIVGVNIYDSDVVTLYVFGVDNMWYMFSVWVICDGDIVASYVCACGLYVTQVDNGIDIL